MSSEYVGREGLALVSVARDGGERIDSDDQNVQWVLHSVDIPVETLFLHQRSLPQVPQMSCPLKFFQLGSVLVARDEEKIRSHRSRTTLRVSCVVNVTAKVLF